ncbi:hypothetical protein GCM10022276_19930 [Sphingomonas limnosediminicola]|uniref:Uncharacterized protein n=1 Tax=Sphingomonas limnosediminicola TaxID=940133 RepID=A0ABP7LFZ7_9SPHN
MLQIIGWLGCLYLFVKGLEILGDQGNRVNRFESDETRFAVPSLIAAILAISGALIFPLVIGAQANQISLARAPVQSYADCLKSAPSLAEMNHCDANR